MQPTLALWVADEPNVILPILDRIAFDVVIHQYPNYDKICQDIFVRIKDLPIGDQLRNLRYVHLNKLIKVTGVVTKRSVIFP